MDDLDIVLEDIRLYRVKRPFFSSLPINGSGKGQKLVNTLSVARCVVHLALHKLIDGESMRVICDFLKRGDCSLKSVDFQGAQLHDVHARFIGDALKENRTLVELDLAFNDITDHGARWIAKGLEGNATVTLLNVEGNCICDAYGDLLQSGEKLVELVGGGSNAEPISAKRLSEAMKHHQNLKTMKFSCTNLGIELAEAFADALRVNKSVTKLDLSENSMPQGAGVVICDALRVHRSVTYLDLGYNKLGQEDAFALAELLKLPEAQLQVLVLDNNPVQDQGAAALSKALNSNTTLKDLSLMKIALTSLACLGNLTDLNISKCSLGPDGARMLGENLKLNRTLRALYLWKLNPTLAEIEEICEGIKVNSALSMLDLSDNDMESPHAQILCKALIANKGITELSLQNNAIGEEGAEDFAKMLRVNSTLLDLDLSYNILNDSGGCAIFNALMCNTTLHSLDMGRCQLESDAASALSELLKVSISLTHLNVSRNRFGAKGDADIAAVVKLNQSLSSLRFDPGNVELVQSIVDVNQNIKILGLFGPRLEHLCRRNGYKRSFRVELSILTFLAIRKWKMTFLNQQAKEVIAMIGKSLLETIEDPRVWRGK